MKSNMRALMISLAGAMLWVSAVQAQEAVTPTERISLFDGKTLAGWTFVSAGTNAPAESIWRATNGVIFCEGKPFGYARTLTKYRDYQLHVEWRWPEKPGNSGVFLHMTPPDKVWALCFEAQLLAGHAGDVLLGGGSHLTGVTDPKVKSMPRQQPSSEKPAGEWNSYDITCRGNSITVVVNGVLQNSVRGTSVDSGAIGLQAEGTPVEFRNITVEKLPQ